MKLQDIKELSDGELNVQLKVHGIKKTSSGKRLTRSALEKKLAARFEVLKERGLFLLFHNLSTS